MLIRTIVSLDPTLLAQALARMAGGIALPIEHLGRLSGGANMESWSFDWGGGGYVLRRAPSAEMMDGRPFGHDVEAAIVRAARKAGVSAPEVVGELVPDDRLGSGYVMRRIEADVSPARILSDPPPALLGDIARELARIHTIPISEFQHLPSADAATMVQDLKTRFASYGGDRPVLALAIKWLEDHVPDPVPATFLHGDFRIGNLMANADGLAAVLDWELCHLGDRHQDLAFGCINSWRFGHIDRPAFGVGDVSHFWAAYEAESGFSVEPDRFRFWLIYSTLWWGMCCLQMADIWRTGLDKTLERAVIGRRVSETEVDLLMLLEDDAPETQRLPIRLDQPAEPRRQGEPSTVEMLEALSDWLEKDVKPKAEGRDRFMAAVALNALGMLGRDAANPAAIHDKSLSDDLLAGRLTLATPGLLARLKKSSLAKLAADQPKYSALAAATRKWSP
jgi:aminoglycoside phosphotransferase (APT) family kinase protein